MGCPSALTFGRDGNGRPIYNRCTVSTDPDGVHDGRHKTTISAWAIDSRGLPAARIEVEVAW